MKKKLFICLVLVVAVFGLLCGAATAESTLEYKGAAQGNATLSGPGELTFSITVSNAGDEDMPGPVKLYYPDMTPVEEFGSPTLAAGNSTSWEGTWNVTQKELESGFVGFIVERTEVDPETGELTTKMARLKLPITYAGAEPELNILRTFVPTVAGKNQEVSVIYEITNTGTAEVSNVTIKEHKDIATTAGAIKSIAPGETKKYVFTVKMGAKDLNSEATVSYKAGGKSYTEKVTPDVIHYGVMDLTATLSADKKGGAPGDTVKLKLTLKNSGKSDYTNVRVTDETLGDVFTGETVRAGETIALEKDLVITETTDLQFIIKSEDANGNTYETATGRVHVIATDPAKQPKLSVNVSVDSEIYELPTDVRCLVSVRNESEADANNVIIYAGDRLIYSFVNIPAGESASFVRTMNISMEGTYTFKAKIKNELGDDFEFESESIKVYMRDPVDKVPGSVIVPLINQDRTEEWEVVDLTGASLENTRTEIKTRAELMNNGMLLCNEWHSRPDDFDETKTVIVSKYVGGNSNVQTKDYSVSLFPVAADALLEAIEAARAEGLEHFLVEEGYRSWETQNSYFQKRMEKLSSKYSGDALIAATKKEVNYPGTSEFNSGMAFTLRLYDKKDPEVAKPKYSTTDQGKWMNRNCWKYGLVFRFPLDGWPLEETSDKSFITGVSTSMNLYRYVGKGNAAIMHYFDFCLEEYLDFLFDHPHIALYEDGVLRYEIYRSYVGDKDTFELEITQNAKSYVASLDNLGFVITVFNYGDPNPEEISVAQMNYSGNPYSMVVLDEAELLKTEEKDGLLEIMNSVSEYSNVGFITYPAGGEEKPGVQKAWEWGNRTFGKDEKYVVFIIDMTMRHLDLYASKLLAGILTSDSLNSVAESVYMYATDGEYGTCAKETFRLVYNLLHSRMSGVHEEARVPDGVLVADIPIGGMTKEDAVRMVEDASDFMRLDLTVRVGNADWHITREEISASVDVERTLQKAMSAENEVSQKDPGEEKKIPFVLNYDHEALQKRAEEIAGFVNSVKPVNSAVESFNFSSKTFTFLEEKPGAYIDSNDLYTLLSEKLDAGITFVTVSVKPERIDAEITKEVLQERFGLISAYSTDTGADETRNVNIQLSTDAVNGNTILPGDTFSFNDAVGEQTEEKGYKMAADNIGEEYRKIIGGGVSQVSSALYNAAVRADLEIVERYPSVWPGDNMGLEAAVNWPENDFRFRNNTEWPVFIVAEYGDGKIMVSVYGCKLDDGIRIDLENAVIRAIPKPEGVHYVINLSLPKGTSIKTSEARNGYEVRTEKVWYQNDVEIRRETLNTTTYLPGQETVEYNPTE